MNRKYAYLLVPLLLLAFFIGRKLYMQPAFDDGEKAPHMSAKLANGAAFQLSDLEGKYVLLDFWGSWCGPCIQEMPGLVELHKKFAGATFQDADGLAIVSVAVEKREDRWRKALEKYDLPWQYHILDTATDLRFFDAPIAKEFGVKQVPTKFLISPTGTILAVDQSIEEVDSFLAQRVK